MSAGDGSQNEDRRDQTDGAGRLNPLSFDEAATVSHGVVDQVESAVIADRDFLELLLTSVVSRGHIHLEDVPGTGKTVTAQILAQSLGVTFNRIQFTPDLLPADITGSHIYDEVEKEFDFQPGPVFANIVLADEINRAPPKTQAALLEAMGEGQVSIEGTSYALPEPFFVIATQNPIEQQGTFELPEAQRDRFTMKSQMGYPERAGERELLNRREDRHSQIPSVTPVTNPDQVKQLQNTAEHVSVSTEVKNYIIDIARETRDDDRVSIGVSPRGVQKMFETVRAFAVVNGRDYVTPHDIKILSDPVLTHRLVLSTDASIRDVDASSITADVLETVAVPGSDGSETEASVE